MRMATVFAAPAVLASVAGCVASSCSRAQPVSSVAFIRGGNIHLAALDGSGAHALTSDGGYTHLSWSPDGKRLVASRTVREGQSRLYVIDAETGHAVNLTPNEQAEGPDWQPSGDLIAYCASKPTGEAGDPVRAECWVVRSDGTQRRRIYAGSTGSPFAPLRVTHCRWHPDGRHVLLFAYPDDGPALTELWAVVDVPSAVASALLKQQMTAFVDAFGDTSLAELTQARGGAHQWAGLVTHQPGRDRGDYSFRTALVVADADGSRRRVLLDVGQDDIIEVAWTPSGEALLATRKREGTDCPNLRWDVWRVDLADGSTSVWMKDAQGAEPAPSRADRAEPATTGRPLAQPAAPPAGARVVFLRPEPTGPPGYADADYEDLANAWMTDIDGGNQVKITSSC
jgi:Tol biopolymer transport system component